MATAVLAGTVVSAVTTEADLVAGGKTVTLELSGATWAPAVGTPTYSAATTKGTTAADSAGGGGGRASNGDLTCSWPSGYTPTAGHFAIMVVYSDAGSGSLPTDWSQVTGSPFGTNTPKLNLFYKVLTGAESAPVTTISGSSGTLSHCAGMVIYTGVGSIGAIGTATAGTGSSMTAGEITTTVNNAIVCAFSGRGDNENAGSQTWGGSGTGMAERLDGGTGAGDDSQVSMADKSFATSGTATGASASTTSVTDPFISVQIELKPSTPFDSARAAIIAGLDSAQAEATGWDAKVKANIPVGNVVRTSDTVCTITLQAQADYDITSAETITATIPATALAGGVAIVAQPYFIVTNTAGGSAGAVGYLPSIGLVFEASSGSPYTMAATAGSFSWSGTAATFKRSVAAVAGAYAWTGTAAAFKRRMAAGSGAFAWSGTALVSRRSMAAGSGAWTWSGTAVAFKRSMAAASGAYTWSGTAATLTRTTARVMGADAAAFGWSGTAVTFKRSTAAASGTFAWAGSAVALRHAYVLPAAAGAFSWTGTAPTLTKASASVMTASAGAFSWTGTSVAFKRSMAASAGSFAWAGTVIGFKRGYAIAASAGAFSWAGTSPVLTPGAQLGRSGGAAFLPSLSTLFEFTGNYQFPVNSGAFTWSGTAVALHGPAKLVASAGAFTWAGTAPALTPRRSVDVYWSDITGEDGYRIKWGTAAGSYTLGTADVAADVETYTITGLAERTTYHWIVMGLLGGVEQEPTDDQVFTVGIPPLIPDAGAFSWTGSAATLTKTGSYSMAAAAGSFAWSGTAVALHRTHLPLAAASGSFTWSGTAVAWKRTYKLAASSGTFTWTGTVAALSRTGSYTMAAPAGAFSWTATAPALTKTSARIMPATSGTFTWSGSAVGLAHGYKMPAAAGTFSWTGTAIAFKRAYALGASSGVFAWSGTTVAFHRTGSYTLPANSGVFALTGNDIVLRYGYSVAGEAGAFSWSGAAIAGRRGYMLEADPATFAWAGGDISGLSFSSSAHRTFTIQIRRAKRPTGYAYGVRSPPPGTVPRRTFTVTPKRVRN